MYYPGNGHFEMKYNQKDRVVDTVIVAVVLGAVALGHDFGNNPPPEIGAQSDSVDIHDKGD